MACDVKKNSENGHYYVEILTKKAFERTQPVCIIDGLTHVKDKDLFGKKIETQLTLVSTSQLWVELPSYKNLPRDMLLHFICHN